MAAVCSSSRPASAALPTCSASGRTTRRRQRRSSSTSCKSCVRATWTRRSRSPVSRSQNAAATSRRPTGRGAWRGRIRASSAALPGAQSSPHTCFLALFFVAHFFILLFRASPLNRSQRQIPREILVRVGHQVQLPAAPPDGGIPLRRRRVRVAAQEWPREVYRRQGVPRRAEDGQRGALARVLQAGVRLAAVLPLDRDGAHPLGDEQQGLPRHGGDRSRHLKATTARAESGQTECNGTQHIFNTCPGVSRAGVIL